MPSGTWWQRFPCPFSRCLSSLLFAHVASGLLVELSWSFGFVATVVVGRVVLAVCNCYGYCCTQSGVSSLSK